jgi:putative transposase
MIEVTNQTENPTFCKYCGSPRIRKYGIYKGVQRYFCNDCRRKFKADDTLFHMKINANLISSTLNMYYEGMSVKAIRRHLQQEHNLAPSTATIYEWIQKFTQYAIDSIKDYHPNVGNLWVADETVLTIDGSKVWFWDIIDDQTRYLLASRISRSRTTRDAQLLIDKAIKTAGKAPKVVITDKLKSYLDVRYGKGAEHKQGAPFNIENNTNLIERFHGTLKARTKVMRGLKNIESAIEFTKGWLAHYNFLRPHESLDDKTPAEVADIEYPYRNWAAIIRKHKPSRPITIEHQPRGRAKLPSIQIGRPHKRIRLSPKTPRISEPMPRISVHNR